MLRGAAHRIPMRRFLAAAAVVTALIGVVATMVQARPVVVSAEGPPLRVEVNKGRVVRLDRPAATVFIADPKIADIQVKSPSLIYVIGLMPGETTLYAVDAEEELLASTNVRVVHNLNRLQSAVSGQYPDLAVSLSSVGNAIVLDGDVPSPSVAEDVRRLASQFVQEEGEVINRLHIQTPVQVNLRVQVAEISRSARKQLGFRWNVNGSIGSFSFGLQTVNPFTENVTPNLIGGALQTANWNANVIIDALADEGLVSILAEPNLTALSGETASFLAGGEFPILVPQGDFRVTIEYKPFGVSVSFTPTILDRRRISLRVRPEVSELTRDGAVDIPFADGTLQIPALRVRRADTTVELGSGQSFAIAGLLQNNIIHDVQKIPGLGDIPVLGQLFRSDDFQRAESELVIIVTPYIVRPAPGAILAAPTDGFSPPSDAERIVYGGTNRRNEAGGEEAIVAPDGSRLVGKVGFMLEEEDAE